MNHKSEARAVAILARCVTCERMTEQNTVTRRTVSRELHYNTRQ